MVIKEHFKLVVNGQTILLDRDIYNTIKQYKIDICKIGKRYVARITVNSNRMYLHRYITKAAKGLVVDHINGDTLDNRMSNLRVITQSDNVKNMNVNTLSNTGFKGIHKRKNLFHVHISSNKKRYHIGSFNDLEVAKLAYNQAAMKLHGEYARLHTTSALNVQKNNTNSQTGIRGIQLQKNGKYSVTIWQNKKRIYLGTYTTLENAKTALEKVRPFL